LVGGTLAELILAIEHWRPGAATAIYQRFRETGRGLPDTVTVYGSWVDPSLSTCWQIMDAPSAHELAEWKERWSDLMEIETVPVITGAEAAQRVT
jgi:hypothetical protein